MLELDAVRLLNAYRDRDSHSTRFATLHLRLWCCAHLARGKRCASPASRLHPRGDDLRVTTPSRATARRARDTGKLRFEGKEIGSRRWRRDALPVCDVLAFVFGAGFLLTLHAGDLKCNP